MTQLKVYSRPDILPEPGWEGLVEKLISERGVAFVIGASDSGKSTLTRYLIEKLVSKDIVTSLVDSDIGQSSIGLPGTISAKIFKTHKDIEDFTAERFFFVGFLNPARKISLMIQGTKKMVDALRANSEVIIVDTTGLVHGELGKELKVGKINAIKPKHVIAIQRQDELEHILFLLEGTNIYRINASPMVIERSRERRIKYRKEKFNKYFDEKVVSEFLLSDADLFYGGKPFMPKWTDFKKGTLIALNHNEDTIALGVLLELDSSSIVFKSPIKSVRMVNRVLLSDINIYD